MTAMICDLEGDEFLYFLSIYLPKDFALFDLSIAKKILLIFIFLAPSARLELALPNGQGF